MKLLALILLLQQLSFADTSKQNCKHTEDRFNCVQYLKNYDGDTVTFKIKNTHPLIGKSISIRVNGIDSPELRTKNTCEKEKARTARRLVKNLLSKAKRIDLLNIKRGKYFRVVADVIYDGKKLKDTLIKNGLAYEYYGKKKPSVDWCSKRIIASEETK